MIVRITGILEHIGEESVVVERDGLAYELLVPAFVLDSLTEHIGQSVTFHTRQYLEASGHSSSFIPRMMGFLGTADRTLFERLTRVKGIGVRKALHCMSMGPGDIALAIERGDEKYLIGLPEIGKRVASQIVAELRGKLADLVLEGASVEPVPAHPQLPAGLTDAVKVLVQLGERESDAVDWVQRVTAADDTLDDPAAIVEAVYRVKAASR